MLSYLVATKKTGLTKKGYPQPGSDYSGPEPAAPAGGWPAFKGTPGARQKSCIQRGGRWIGPTARKWCQLTPDSTLVDGGGSDVVGNAAVVNACSAAGGVWDAATGVCMSQAAYCAKYGMDYAVATGQCVPRANVAPVAPSPITQPMYPTYDAGGTLQMEDVLAYGETPTQDELIAAGEGGPAAMSMTAQGAGAGKTNWLLWGGIAVAAAYFLLGPGKRMLKLRAIKAKRASRRY